MDGFSCLGEFGLVSSVRHSRSAKGWKVGVHGNFQGTGQLYPAGSCLRRVIIHVPEYDRHCHALTIVISSSKLRLSMEGRPNGVERRPYAAGRDIACLAPSASWTRGTKRNIVVGSEI